MDLDILHEDEDLLVLNKSAGRVVHPGAGTGEDTLVHGILHHCQGRLSGIGGKERPGIVHRLDKETSGLLLVAKSDTAFQSLAEQFASRTIRKFYTALVRGIPDPVEGSIEEPIGRHPVHRLRMTVRAEGRDARTDFQVIRQWELASMVRLRIHTGRTHQIRVHMKHLDHPVLGDKLYGYKPPAKTGFPEVPRVMLHAARLEFGHPVSGQPFKMEVPLPEDFSAVIDALDGDIRETESR
jgi:23S rRNA pseudouridine1911/1915/1917 synthase